MIASCELAIDAACGRAGHRDIIISGSADQTIRIWDAATGQPLRGHDRAVTAVAMGRAGDRDIIISGSHDQAVVLWARNERFPSPDLPPDC